MNLTYEALLEILGDIQAASLTAQKTVSVQERDGYEITGFVLSSTDGSRCIIEKSAVRWISKEEMWWLMQISEKPIPNAGTLATRGLESAPENHAGDGQPSGLPAVYGSASSLKSLETPTN